jgi:hypothetical protein
MTKPTAKPPKDSGIPPKGRPADFGTGPGDKVGNVGRGDKRLPKTGKGK